MNRLEELKKALFDYEEEFQTNDVFDVAIKLLINIQIEEAKKHEKMMKMIKEPSTIRILPGDLFPYPGSDNKQQIIDELKTKIQEYEDRNGQLIHQRNEYKNIISNYEKQVEELLKEKRKLSSQYDQTYRNLLFRDNQVQELEKTIESQKQFILKFCNMGKIGEVFEHFGKVLRGE